MPGKCKNCGKIYYMKKGGDITIPALRHSLWDCKQNWGRKWHIEQTLVKHKPNPDDWDFEYESA